MSEGRTKAFLRRLRSAASTPINSTTTTTISYSSSSSSSSSTSSLTSQKPFRAIYTVDHCGYELSYRGLSPKRSSSKKPMSSPAPFLRAAYTLDGQGLDLSGKSPLEPKDSKEREITPRSYDDWAVEQQPNGFRSLYTMDWKPCAFVRKI
jgi:hypothetical protein